MISVVCPFFNEEAILEASVRQMAQNLATLPDEWELIVVNDGSLDGSLAIAQRLEREIPQLRAIGYAVNRGRGYAIRTGVNHARGDIVVTTEIDSSWGDDVVHRIVAEFQRRPDADMIIASPHLPGGGYKNVPWSRVWLSTLGNYIIRAGMTNTITMNTGMTRGYRREKFLALPLDEEGKELHLEIVNKALTFNYRIYEIPTVLEWKDSKFIKDPRKKRKSSSKINKLVVTHLSFSILAAPFRYIYTISTLLFLVALLFFGMAVYNLFTPGTSIFYVLTSFFLILFGLLFFGIGVLAHQGLSLQRELWRLRADARPPPPGPQESNNGHSRSTG